MRAILLQQQSSVVLCQISLREWGGIESRPSLGASSLSVKLEKEGCQSSGALFIALSGLLLTN